MNSKLKDEDSDSPYTSDKSSILQEARAFNDSPINPRKCRLILTKILHLLHAIPQPLNPTEATDLFFSITKLFQSKDTPLRQMVYLAIKELSTIANDVIMVTSSLTKDINSTTDVVYKSNAIRALCKITDGSMLQSIERFLKQSIVSQVPSISSGALCSSLFLFHHVPGSKDVIKRWINEVSESLQKPGIQQYHALGLMYNLKKEDKVGVVKMLMGLAKSVKSPFAICVLVRVAKGVVQADLEAGGDGSKSKPMYDLLESWLRHKNDMVVYESARSICSLPNPTSAQLFPAVSALQLLLLNHKPTLRFAAIRTLNKLAMTHPVAVWPCNLDMENLITDSNRSVATFAITTLLKTGTEASVDRLMKQISGFMSEISEEFKIIVIDAIRSLCLKFPSKQVITLNFLSGVLRDEGGYEFKRSIVEAIFDIIYHVPDSKEFALSHLCEFIEDCEFTKLAVRILHLIGTVGPTTPNPSKYIRYIYNRVILENAVTRAAAVSALASFAVRCEGLKGRIIVLLQRCLDDVDDEVRDRAVFYLGLIGDEGRCERFVIDDSAYSWSALEHNIMKYLSDPTTHNVPFDISNTPIITKDQEQAETLRAKTAIQENIGQAANASLIKPTSSSSSPTTGNAFDTQTQHAKLLDSIPELAKLGSVFKSGGVVELTESETEYVVGCVKHVYNGYVVFQFTCKNTLQECLLENVTVAMEMQPQDEDEIMESGAHVTQIFTLPAKKLEYEVPANVFVVWEIVKSNSAGVALGEFSNVLKFKQREVDVTTGELEEDGFEDEYLLEDLELGLSDYIQPLYISDFRKSWEELGSSNEVIETYSLTAVQGVKAAVTTLNALLGMQPCEQTQNIPNEKATTHTLLLAGTFIGGVKVLVRCRIAYDPSSGVTLEIAVRGADRGVCDRVANCIQ